MGKMVLRGLVYGLLGAVGLLLLLGMGGLAVLMLAPRWVDELVRQEVAAAMEGSDYGIEFGRLVYAPLGGLTVYGLELRDSAGVVAGIDKVTLDVDYMALLGLQLKLSVDGEVLTVYRRPVETAGEDEPVSGFVMPSLGLRGVEVERLAFRRVELREPVAGRMMRFAPVLEAQVRLGKWVGNEVGNMVGVWAQGRLGAENSEIPWPEEVTVAGRLRTTDVMVAVEELRVVGPGYVLTGAGTGGWLTGGVLNYRAEVTAADMTAVSGGEVASATAVVQLTGTVADAVLGVVGEVVPARLREVVDKVVLRVRAEDVFEALRGTVALQTRYEQLPVVVEGQFTYAEPQLRLEQISATAPGVTLAGQGVLDTDTLLAEGEVVVRVADLARYAKVLGEDVAGQVSVRAEARAAGEAQVVAVETVLTRGRYEDISLQRLAGSARFGNVRQSVWPEMVDAQVQELRLAEDAVLRTGTVALQRSGADEVYGLTVAGRGWTGVPVTLEGQATLREIASGQPLVEGMVVEAQVRGSKVVLRGNVGREELEVTATTDRLRLGDLPLGEIPDGMRRLLLSGTARMDGTLAAPQTEVQVELTQPTREGWPVFAVNGILRHDGRMAVVELTGRGEGVKALRVEARVPLEFGWRPFVFELADSAVLSGMVRGALDAGAIGRLVLPASQVVAGEVNADLVIGGTVAAPQITGPVTLRHGRFVDEENGVVLADLRADGALQQDRLVLRDIGGGDGEAGRLSGQGVVTFGEVDATNVLLRFDNLHLPRTGLVNGFVDGQLTLADAVEGYLVNGRIDVRTLNILIPDTFAQRIPELNIVRRGDEGGDAVPVALAIQLRAPNQVFVRGWGLDAEFGGELAIGGTIDAPVMNGTLASSRGRYSEFGQRFTLERANLQFIGPVPPSPYLDVAAVTTRGEVTANITISGPFEEPVFAFSSSPALPQDEVLSHLLFGEGVGSISPFQAVQLGQTLQRLSGRKSSGFGFDPLGTLRSVTGLDDIDIETDESGATTFGAGKYLTDKVYLEVEQGGAEGTGAANIQIELTPRVRVESTVGREEGSGAGIFWKRDY